MKRPLLICLSVFLVLSVWSGTDASAEETVSAAEGERSIAALEAPPGDPRLLEIARERAEIELKKGRRRLAAEFFHASELRAAARP